MRRVAFLVLLISFAGAQAEAYECTEVPNSNPRLTQAWNQRCVPYYIHTAGTLVDGEARRLLIQQSFQVWESLPCTDITFNDAGYTEQPPGFDPNRRDNQNIIVSVENLSEARALFTRSELALTITSFNTATGEIFDADILINGAQFSFEEVADTATCLGLPAEQQPFDIRNMLVHEIGHFIGFEHDFDGESTMFASAPECETKKRSLTNDNIAGICDVYASGQPTRTCSAPSSYELGRGNPADFRRQCERAAGELDGGCTCASAPTSGAVWILLMGLLGWLGARKLSGR